MAALGAGVRGLSGFVKSLDSREEDRSVRRATIRSVLVDTVRKDGALGLYRGIGPTLLGIVPYAGMHAFKVQVSICLLRWIPLSKIGCKE